MSAQQQRDFDSAPGSYTAVGSVADAPSVQTQQSKATAAQFTNDGRGLVVIRQVLSPEGTTTAKFAEMRDRVGSVVHGDDGDA